MFQLGIIASVNVGQIIIGLGLGFAGPLIPQLEDDMDNLEVANYEPFIGKTR